MRYLTRAEALIIGEAVTGLDAITLTRASRVDLLDSALHAPQAGFGDQDRYPAFEMKAAVQTVRIARNHPLPDGNKRLAWMCLRMFCAINGHHLDALPHDAVAAMFSIAAGAWNEDETAHWIADHLAGA